jgi:hypothetical protein
MTDNDIVWDDKQEEAIAACCDTSRRIVAVTGKAGTGVRLHVASWVQATQYRAAHQQGKLPSAYVKRQGWRR